MDVRYSGDRHDGTDAGFLYLRFIQAVKFIQLADLYLNMLVRVMMVADNDFLIDPYDAVVHFADTDTAYIFIVVNGADEYLGAGFAVAFGCRDVVDDGFKQRLHADAGGGGIRGGNACFCGGVDKGTVQLGVVRVKFQEQFQHFVHHFIRPGFGTVDFIDAYDDWKLQFQSLPKHEFGLGHGSFEGIYYQDDTVYHFQNTFHFSAEIGVTGSVYNIDFCVFIHDGSIFGQNGNSAFPLNVIGVHNALRHCLTFTEYTALF